jgi:hypothetical protein
MNAGVWGMSSSVPIDSQYVRFFSDRTIVTFPEPTPFEVGLIQKGNDPWAQRPAPVDVKADRVSFGAVWITFEQFGKHCASFRADQVLSVIPNWAIDSGRV